MSGNFKCSTLVPLQVRPSGLLIRLVTSSHYRLRILSLEFHTIMSEIHYSQNLFSLYLIDCQFFWAVIIIWYPHRILHDLLSHFPKVTQKQSLSLAQVNRSSAATCAHLMIPVSSKASLWDSKLSDRKIQCTPTTNGIKLDAAFNISPIWKVLTPLYFSLLRFHHFLIVKCLSV